MWPGVRASVRQEQPDDILGVLLPLGVLNSIDVINYRVSISFKTSEKP